MLRAHEATVACFSLGCYSYPMTGKLDDREWLTRRAQAGARAAHSLPSLISRIERRQTELTEEDRERLAALGTVTQVT